MIPIFDLDDTLYPERTYVESGFKAVAKMLEQCFGWSAGESLAHMFDTLAREGRGLVFDRLLESKNAHNSSRVRACIKAYRHHRPTIKLAPMAREVLGNLGTYPYLVTDGHKVVQQNKVEALNLQPLFKKIYITHRYGIRHAKPSTYCFELIKRRENCEWSDMFYVGDNPGKDFVNLNLLGVHTIRIATGEHSRVAAREGFDAVHHIKSLDDLKIVLKEIFP
jgi:putative hydrolase of the HAD superfamily